MQKQMKRIAWCLVFVVFLVLLVGCSIEDVSITNETADDVEVVELVEETPVEDTVEEEEEEEEEEVVAKDSCMVNADCGLGLLCIDNKCGIIADLFVTEDCDATCGISSVDISTSDDESYNLSLGEGSYSYAGALEWKLKSIPTYCEGQVPLVPIAILKKSLGKVLSEKVITLEEGATSALITHPSVASVQFTATLDNVVEECS
jgi:hypothetical protein